MKEGILIGGALGFIAGKWLLPNVFDLNSIAQAQSALDFIKPITTTIITFAKTKLIVATTLVGALAGAIIDDMVPEGFLKRRGR